MTSLTIILKSECTKFVRTVNRRKPFLISKVLRKESKKRSIVGIFEGLPNLDQIKKDLIRTSTSSIFLVLRIKFKKDFTSANSESIWKCINEFAKNKSLLFSVSNNSTFQIVEFEKNIQM